jgi:hypothetical protein
LSRDMMEIVRLSSNGKYIWKAKNKKCEFVVHKKYGFYMQFYS